MRILLLTSQLPYPLHHGNRLRLNKLLQYLSRNHEITLISFVTSEEGKVNRDKLKGLCDTSIMVSLEESVTFSQKIKYLLSAEPYTVNHFKSNEMESVLRKVLRQSTFDIIHVEGLEMAQYVVGFRDVLIVISPIDAISLYHQRMYRLEKAISYRKIIHIIEYYKTLRYEDNILPQCHRCILVSEYDKQFILKRNVGVTIEVIPNGVDAQYFHYSVGTEEFPTLMFLGVMNYPPNVVSLLYFYDAIFPIIRKEYPKIKLYIVGINPAHAIRELSKDANVVVTGYVEDVRPIMAKTTIFICPMIAGQGIKNKLLEALSMRKPVVATPMSIEGITSVEDKVHLLFGDDPASFANAVIQLLKDKTLRQGLGVRGRDFVMKNYSWEHAGEKLESLYSRLLGLK